MSTYQWHCAHPTTVNESWHLAYPDGKVWRSIRRDEDGLWRDDRYGVRHISLAAAKAFVVDEYEDMYSINKEDAVLLDAWVQLPWYERIFTDKPHRPEGL